MHGQISGGSQLSHKSNSGNPRIVWNFPFELGFRSTSPKGWPICVLTLVGPDFRGREVIKGYGNVHVPPMSGRFERQIRLFRPEASSMLVRLVGWLKGKLAELIDPSKTLGRNEGREVTRMRSGGTAKIVFIVKTINMEVNGYECS